jgi:hypothetical protein
MVSICYIVKSDYWITKCVIDNLIKKSCGCEIELIICNTTKDSRTKVYLENLVKNKEFSNLMTVLVDEKEDMGLYLYLDLFKYCKGDYICVHPERIFVENNYLVDLCYANYNIEKSGLTAIKNTIKDLELVPLLMTTQDEFHYVWKNKNNYIDGVYVFKKSLLSVVNDIYKFNSELTSQGFNNYYLTNQNATNV